MGNICRDEYGNYAKTHGMSQNNMIYKRWGSMKNRCNNPNSIAYERYGGRGIKVCEEWDKSFQSFYKWAIENGFEENLTLDRIDNNKEYFPENCRWVTTKIQNRNCSRNHFVTYNGKTQCIADWSDETGIRRDTLLYRLNHCKNIDEVFYAKNRKTACELMKPR